MSDNYVNNKPKPLPARGARQYETYTPADVRSRIAEARKDLTDPKSPLAKVLADPDDLETHLKKVERLIISSVERAAAKTGRDFDREKFVEEVAALVKEDKPVVTKTAPPPAKMSVPKKVIKPEDVDQILVINKRGEAARVKASDMAKKADTAGQEEAADDGTSRGLLRRVGKDALSVAFPTLSKLGRKIGGEKGETTKEKMSRLGDDALKTAFPTLSKVIEYVQTDSKQKSVEGVRETSRSKRSLDTAEGIASAIQSLTAEQKKGVDHLAELLNVVKGLRGGGGPGGPNIEIDASGKMLDSAGKLLRRAAPYAAGAAALGAAGVGAYALGGISSGGGETPAPTETEQEGRQQTRAQPAPPASPAVGQTAQPERRVFRRSGAAGELSFSYERTADGKHYVDGREVDAQTYNRVKQLMFVDERNDPRLRQYIQEAAARDDFAPEMTARARLSRENDAELTSTIQRIRTQPVAERPAAPPAQQPAAQATPAAAPTPEPAIAGPRIRSGAQPRITRPPATPVLGEGAMAASPYGADAGSMGLEPVPTAQSQPSRSTARSNRRGTFTFNGVNIPFAAQNGTYTIGSTEVDEATFNEFLALQDTTALHMAGDFDGLRRRNADMAKFLNDIQSGRRRASNSTDTGAPATTQSSSLQERLTAAGVTPEMAQERQRMLSTPGTMVAPNMEEFRRRDPEGAREYERRLNERINELAEQAIQANIERLTAPGRHLSQQAEVRAIRSRAQSQAQNELFMEFADRISPGGGGAAAPRPTPMSTAPAVSSGRTIDQGLGLLTPTSAPAASGGGGSSEGSGSQQLATKDTAADTGSLSFASGVDPRIKKDIAQKVQQIESAFGKKLTITSGFRDPHRNAAAGGARNSAHTRANAVDIQFQGNEEDTNKLIEAASAAGIGGIGVYRPGWVHLDVESKRVWGPDFSARTVPEWAKDTLQAHMTGEIAKSPAAEQVSSAPASPSMTESSGGGEGGGSMAASPAPGSPGGQMGSEVAGASQENAMAERTPVPPTVTAVEGQTQGQASPGRSTSEGSIQSPNDPGNVEPMDAAERYSKLFNMAA
jgi:hypothetical protein